jgi:cold shock protein
MQQGTVKWFSGAKGFGFITSDDGTELFFHRSQLDGDHATIRDNQAVKYEIGEGRRGPEAVEVRLS